GEGAEHSPRGRGRSPELRAKLEKIVLGAGPLARTSATLSPSEAERDVVRGPPATSMIRKARLHALWTLIGGGALEPAFHLKVLAHPDPAYRAWGARAAGNFGNVSPAIRKKLTELARDPSPDVQLQVAIASRKIKGFDAL